MGEKDLKIENGNYLADFDISKMPKVESSEVITLQSGETITVSDYISLISQQEVGFETKEEYQQYAIQAMVYNLESMKQVFQSQNDSDGIMSNGFSCLKELTGLGISTKDVENIISEQEEIINALIAAANGQSDLTFEDAYEKYTGTKFSTEKIDNYMRTSNIASAINSACYYDKDYADKLEEATGKSVDEINQEFALCQNEVLGKSQALQNLVDDYSASQEGFADKLSAIISTTGMVCIVAGAIVSFIPGGATIGVPLMTAGKWVAFGGMLTDNAIDLVDHSTDKDGLTGDEVKNLALETGVEVVSYAAGRGIGKLTNGLNTMVANEVTKQGVGKVGSYVLGQTAETFADTALSLTADYAIAQGQSLLTTGEMMSWDDYWSVDRFLGEGRNQLMGILTGLSSSKVNAYSQGVIATAQGKIQAGDIEGAKTYLKQKGLGQYASGTKFNNLEASANMPKIMPEVNAKIQAGDIEGAKQILSNNGLSNYTTGKNFASIEKQAYISKAQEMIGTGDIEGAKQYLNNNGLEKYSTGDNFKSIQAKANAPQIIAEAQRMILEGNEKGAQEYLKEQGLVDYSQRDNFYQLTIQTKAPQIMQEVERLILEGDETGAKQYLKDNGFKEYTNKEKFNAIVNNIKTANMQAQAVETAKTMILEGKSAEAKKLLEDSGLEIDDESFKALSDETLKSENDTDPSTETISSGNLKIGLQFFAEKQADNIETKGSDDLNNSMNNEAQQKQYDEFVQKAISEIMESNGSIETDNLLNKIISYYEAEGTPIKTLEELRKTNETYAKILNKEAISEQELSTLHSEIEDVNLNIYEKLLYNKDIETAKILQNSMVGIEFHHAVNGYSAYLRTRGYENLSAEDKQIIDLIDEQFANLPPTEYDINLKRGISFNKSTTTKTQKEYFEKLKNLQQGEVLTEKAPIYTTPNEALAEHWTEKADWFESMMMDIETPSGSKISRVIDGGREEYLFPRDAQFEVTKPYYIDEDGTPRIGLKYIQPQTINSTTVNNESFKAVSDETLKSENDTNPSIETSSSGHQKIDLQFFGEKPTTTETNQDIAIALKNSGIELDTETLNKYIKFIQNNGFEVTYENVKLLTLSTEERISLLETKNVEYISHIKLSLNNNKAYLTALKLAEVGVTDGRVLLNCLFDSESCQKALDLANKGITNQYIIADAIEDDYYYERSLSCIEAGIVDKDIIDKAVYDESYHQKVLEYENKGIFSSQDINLMEVFESYTGIKNITDLTPSQKLEFLDKLLNNSSLIEDNHLSEHIPILPNNGNDYFKIINEIVQNESKSNITISSDDISKLNTSLDKIISDSSKNDSNTNTLLEYVANVFSQTSLGELDNQTINSIKSIVSNPEFKNMTENNQKVLLMSTLFKNSGNSSYDSACNAVQIAKQLGLSDNDITSLYQVIKNYDKAINLLNSDINDNGYLAYRLKDGASIEILKQLISSDTSITLSKDKINLFFEKLEQNAYKYKTTDFILPQTDIETISKNSTTQNINGYTLHVLNASDIEDFYVFVHSIELSANSNLSNNLIKMANLKSFEVLGDERIISTSYIGDGRYGTFHPEGKAENGFILDVDKDNLYAGGGFDINSPKSTVERMTFMDNSLMQYNNSRAQISDNIKKIMGISDTEYVERLENIKAQTGRSITFSDIKKYDTELYNAYREYLSRTNETGNEETGFDIFAQDALMRSTLWNEVLVSNPKIKAIFTKNIDELPESYLQFAQQENIPIVILD